MKKINETFDRINGKSNNWENDVLEYLDKEDDNKNDDYENFFNEIADIYKEIDNDELSKEELKKYTKNENVIEKIHEEICKRNSWFNDLRVLRQLEKNEPKMLNYIYESIFNNYILHIDITALEYLSNLFTNVECGEKELLNCARALDFASELYVRNLFSKNTMLEEFSEKSGIERENALFFIELISKNEMEIKINYLMKCVETKSF